MMFELMMLILFGGMICGALLMLVFQKDFWRLVSVYYKTFTKENRRLNEKKMYWQSLCIESDWFKDKNLVQDKLIKISAKASKLADKDMALQIRDEEIENNYKKYSVQLDAQIKKLESIKESIDIVKESGVDNEK
jgi:hypothetical protein